VPKYIVERHLPGITPDQLAGAAGRAKTATAEMSEEGVPVRYLRSTFLPVEEKCYCLFEAASPDAVEDANRRAEIPYERVVEAMHISRDDV
jgi:hypothetical protein